MEGRARRRLVWIGGGLVTLVVVVVAAVLFFFRDAATPVTRDEVAATLSGGGGGEPGDDGVYAYETVGYEEVDALGGGRHDYPAETFFTIGTAGCGKVTRWQALRERWEEHIVCDDGRLEGIDSYHEWFGISNLHQYRCAEDAHTYPRSGEASWTFTCGTDGTTEEYTYEVIGTEELEIGGEVTVTLHLRVTSTLSGETVGDSESHEWVLPGTNLIVRQTSRVDNVTDTSVGDVTYHEEYEVVLRSLTPVG